MIKYIPLDTLVAELKRRIEEITQSISLGNKKIQKSGGNRRAELERFLSFLNSLEVKEVNIDKLCEFRKNVGFAYPECASEYQKQLACYRQGIEDVIEALKGE